MLRKNEFRDLHPEIHTGMTAYTHDGEKLGKVVELEDDDLIVEKGIFFPKDFTLRYDDVESIHDDSLTLKQNEDTLKDWHNKDYVGWDEYEKENKADWRSDTEAHRDTGVIGKKDTDVHRDTSRDTGVVGEKDTDLDETKDVGRKADLRGEEHREIPLYEERISARKVAEEKGEARVRKVVHTEIKHIDVPVSKEEVVIERKPGRGEDVSAEAGAFKEEEVRIPIREERVEVTKHPVEKERVEVRKEKHTERQTVGGEVKSEDIEVEDKGDVEHKK